MKQNPVCDLSSSNTEALTINLLGELEVIRENAKKEHRDLLNRLSDISAKHAFDVAGTLTKQVSETQIKLAFELKKLEESLDQIGAKVEVLRAKIVTNKAGPRYVIALSNLTVICLIACYLSL